METTVCPILLARRHGIHRLPQAASCMESLSPIPPYTGGPMEQPALLSDVINLWTRERSLLRPGKEAK